MRIALTLALDITRHTGDPDTPDDGDDISGAGSLIEHANHDSTPRILGFTATPSEEA